MSWVHEEWGRHSCPCGLGEIVVTMHESDNGYSGDHYSADFTCEACRRIYDLETESRGSSFKVRRKADRAVVLTHADPPLSLPSSGRSPK